METNSEPVGEKQRVTVLNYMEKHCYFARGQITKLGRNGKRKFDRMWKNLTDNLNEIGPAKKTIAGWKQAWDTIKSSSKKIKIKYNKAINKTGNKIPNDANVPNQFEERVCDIYGVHGLGQNVVAEVGVRFVGTRQYRPSSTDWGQLFNFLLLHPELIDAKNWSSPLWNNFASTYRIAEGPLAGQTRDAKNWFKSWSQRRDTAIKNCPNKEDIVKLHKKNIDRLTIEVLMKGKEYPDSQFFTDAEQVSKMDQTSASFPLSNLTPQQLMFMASSTQRQHQQAPASPSPQQYHFRQNDANNLPLVMPKAAVAPQELQSSVSKPSTLPYFIQQQQQHQLLHQPQSNKAVNPSFSSQQAQQLTNLLPLGNLSQPPPNQLREEYLAEKSEPEQTNFDPISLLKMILQHPGAQQLLNTIGIDAFHQSEQSNFAAYPNPVQNMQVPGSMSNQNSMKRAVEESTIKSVDSHNNDQNKKIKIEDNIIAHLIQALLDEHRSHHIEMRKLVIQGIQKMTIDVQNSIQTNYDALIKHVNNFTLTVVQAEGAETPAVEK